MTRRWPRSLAPLLVGALCGALGCGTNRPEIPEEYLQGTSGDGGGSYPAGPYCKNKDGCVAGATIEDFEFGQGWLDPAAAGYDIAQLAPIRLSDFHDPDGSKNVALLLLNTAAFWCGACQSEHGGTSTIPSLSERYDEYRPRGLEILSLVFQDAQSQPASEADLAAWAKKFETRFPLARDPEYQMGRYAASDTAPLNLLVDATTMVIVEKYLGDQAAVIWPRIDAELAKRR